MKYIQCPVNRIARSADKNKTAVLGSSGPVSYLRLEELICQAARYLKSLGIKQKTKTGLLLPNGIDFIVAYFALLRMGAIPVLINLHLPSNVVREEFIKMRCRILIAPKDNTRKLHSIKCVNLDISVIETEDGNPVFQRYQLNKTSNIMFTSGSGGKPKAVVHTIENHYYSALGSNKHIPLGHGDQWILSLPTYHVSGLSVLWRVFISGSSLSVVDDSGGLIQTIRKFKPTHISLVSTQLIKCMRDTPCRKVLSRMRCILIGGGAVNPTVIQTALDYKLPVYLSYGLTEMSSQVATSKKVFKKEGAGAVMVLPYRLMKIDSQQNVLVKGKTLFKGYFVNGRTLKKVDKKGWFNTGDLGFLTKDSGLKIIGRKDNMFISGGENIHPEQIEQEILKSRLIEEAVVVPAVDPLYGQRPVAFLKTVSGKRGVRKKLIKHLNLRLEKFKIPDEFFYLPETESTVSIKINRKKLTELVRKNSSLLSKVN